MSDKNSSIHFDYSFLYLLLIILNLIHVNVLNKSISHRYPVVEYTIIIYFLFQCMGAGAVGEAGDTAQ